MRLQIVAFHEAAIADIAAGANLDQTFAELQQELDRVNLFFRN
ncbi:hypothetical protein [Paenibacillus marinisediminis]